jgi:hypothetical protein
MKNWLSGIVFLETEPTTRRAASGGVLEYVLSLLVRGFTEMSDLPESREDRNCHQFRYHYRS